MSERIDWTGGPRSCTACGRPMRPKKRRAAGQWAGTVVYGADGRCNSCRGADYRRRKKTEAQEREAEAARAAAPGRADSRPVTATSLPDGLRVTRLKGAPCVVLDWLMVPGVPRAHCLLEATADLADLLVSQGLVATGPVESALARGGRVLRLRVPVRTVTLSERDALARTTHEPEGA